MKVVGAEINGFNVPVCNCFKAKLIHDQLCYEVDLKKFERKENRENELKHGLILLLDVNAERQSFDGEMKTRDYTKFYLKETDNSVQIHLDTICKNLYRIFHFKLRGHSSRTRFLSPSMSL